MDIEEFFKPLHCVEIKLGYNDERRLSGDGLVTFASAAEARDALSRNKRNIGTRLFKLNCTFMFCKIVHVTKQVTVNGVLKISGNYNI